MSAFVWCIFRRMCMKICYMHFCCQLAWPQLQNSRLNDYISGKLSWSFCAHMCTDRLTALTGWFLLSLLRSKRSLLNISLCTEPSIEKCWPAKKYYLNIAKFFRIWLKLSASLKLMPFFGHIRLFLTSTPGFPVHHQLPELAQTHVHWVGDAIQSSHPLSSPSPPAFNLSQYQGLF